MEVTWIIVREKNKQLVFGVRGMGGGGENYAIFKRMHLF